MAGPKAGNDAGQDAEMGSNLSDATTTCRRDEFIQAATTPRSVEGSASPDEDNGVVRMTLDTAAGENVPSSDYRQGQLVSSGPSKVRALVAGGGEINAARAITSALDFGDDVDRHVTFHVLSENKTWLLSISKLTAIGFEFFLSDVRPSYMVTPNGVAVQLGRDDPDRNAGFWHIDFSFPSMNGFGRILNRIETDNDGGESYYLGSHGEELVRIPRDSRVAKVQATDTRRVRHTTPLLTAMLFGSDSADPDRAVTWRGRAHPTHAADDIEAREVFSMISASMTRAESDTDLRSDPSDDGTARYVQINPVSGRDIESERGTLRDSMTTDTHSHGGVHHMQPGELRTEGYRSTQHREVTGGAGASWPPSQTTNSTSRRKKIGPRTDSLGAQYPSRAAEDEDSDSSEQSQDATSHASSRTRSTTRARGSARKRSRKEMEVGRRSLRGHATNGETLHAALGHPSGTRFERWSRSARGFPRRIDRAARCRCRACLTGKMSRQPVPSHAVSDNDSEPGTSWSFDISRTWDPDLFGYTAFVIFVDDASCYVCVYPISDHTEFFEVARKHVAFVRRRFKKDIEWMRADYDPMWSSTSSRDFDPLTAEAREFSDEYGIQLERAPPYTQSMSKAESVIGTIMGTANQQIIYAHLSAEKFWWTSVRHAATCHNLGPVVGSETRPLLRGDTTPYEVMTGQKSDIAMLKAAPFGALCWMKVMRTSADATHGVKPSQFKPVSKPGLVLGLAPDTLGWIVLPLSEIGNQTRRTSVTYHMVPDNDMSRRPAILAQHDQLLAESPLSPGPGAFNKAIRDLFKDQTGVENALIVFDELTDQPVRLEQMIDPTTTEVTLQPSGTGSTSQATDSPPVPETSQPDGARLRRQRRRHRESQADDESESIKEHKTAPSLIQVNSEDTEHERTLVRHAAARLRALGGDTPIRIEQKNPHPIARRRAHQRYEQYKSATTLAEFSKLGGREKDAARDFRHNRLSIPTSAVLGIADPILALAAMVDVEEVMEKGQCVADDTSVNACVAAVRVWGGTHPAQGYEPHQTPTGDAKYDSYLADSRKGGEELERAHTSVCAVTASIASAMTPRTLSAEAPEFIPSSPSAHAEEEFDANGRRSADDDHAPYTPNHGGAQRTEPQAEEDALPRPYHGGVRPVVIALAKELAASGDDKLVTAKEAIDNMSKRVDAAIESLTPGRMFSDPEETLVCSAMASAPFSDNVDVAGPLRDPTNMNEYHESPDKLEFRKAMYKEAYQLLDEYDTLEHVTEDVIRAYRAAGKVVRVVPSKGVWKRKFKSDLDVSFDRHKWRWCAC